MNVNGCIDGSFTEPFSLFLFTHSHKLQSNQLFNIYQNKQLILIQSFPWQSIQIINYALSCPLQLRGSIINHLIINFNSYYIQASYLNTILNFSMIHTPMSSAIITTLLLSLLSLSFQHFIPKIDGGRVDIIAYTNQAKEIQIPFNKCFQVETQLPANSKYVNFEQSSLKLTEIRQVQISESKKVSVLDDLRSPISYTYEHLIVYDNYAITFMPPNMVMILKQEDNEEYKIFNRIRIQQMDQYSQIQMYKFNNQTMLFVYNTHKGKMRTFIISPSGYFEIKVPINGQFSHFVANGKQFFTAEYGEGINCYSYNEDKKTAALVASYSRQTFKNLTQYPYIVDLNIDYLEEHKIIYALDGIKGVFRLNLTQSLMQPQIQLVISEPNCNALDSMNIDHMVIVCQLGSASYIIEAYANKSQKGETVFTKIQPEYHVNYFNDLEINNNYFLVFSHRTLNVYWSAKENNIPQTVNTRSQLDLPGLQTFYFRMNAGAKGQSYLYVIQSGILKQMLITESNARLTIKSSFPAQKTFKLSIFGNCQDLSAGELKNVINNFQTSFNLQKFSELKSSTCELQKVVSIQIIQQVLPRKEDFSVSASIVVIIIVIFLVIIWICLKKYKGLERQARRVLEAYRKKKTRI